MESIFNDYATIRFINLCDAGLLENAKQIYETFNDEQKSRIEYKLLFKRLCYKGYLDIIKWFIELYPELIDEYNNIFMSVCISGHTHIIKWLMTLGKKFDILGRDGINFINSCSFGHINIAKYLYKVFPRIINYVDCNQIFYNICMNGHINVGLWLLSLKQDIDIFGQYNINFINSCNNNYLNIAQWLYKKNPDIINHVNYNQLFVNATNEDNLNIAKWIYLLKPDIDISVNNNEILYNCLNKSNINILKWFYELKPELITIINKYSNKHFENCCIDDLQLAIWFYELNPNNYSDSNYLEIFKQTVYYGNLDSIKWLYGLKPEIDLDILKQLLFYSQHPLNISNKRHNEISSWLKEKINENFDITDNFINIIINHKYDQEETIEFYHSITQYYDLNKSNIDVHKYNHYIIQYISYTVDYESSIFKWFFTISQSTYNIVNLKNENYMVTKNISIHDIQNNDGCTICQDDDLPCDIYTRCKHSFHFNCLDTWLTTQTDLLNSENSCPYCRTEISYNEFPNLEDLTTIVL